MQKFAFALLGTMLLAGPVLAKVQSFPTSFKSEVITSNGVQIHVRVGGKGPAVVLLHGFGETGDMWEPLAAELVRDHTVVVPDLRGMGRSSLPAGGYDKKTQGGDVAGVLDALKIDRTFIRDITTKLEQHYRDMQDFEFTIEDGTLYMLQTRNGKRTGPAAVRVAVDMVEEGMIDPKEAEKAR